MNWSWDKLKTGMQGLLADPNATMENPWFQAGMGLLSENTKPYGGNWAAGALGGMAAAKETEQQRKDRERIEELRRQIADWMRQQYGGAVMSPQGGMMSPLPQGQMPPKSIMDLYRTSGK